MSGSLHIQIRIVLSLCLLYQHNSRMENCDDLQLLNVVLTNTRIVFLTTLGLFISEDLRYGNFSELKFDKPNFCGFEMDDYMKAKIWYSVQCLANQENYEGEENISASNENVYEM
uniref:Uncharacterized protein n=1 Tax=Sphaerodactylus townsendi TaxID=933632 RepID=A0ACB8G5T8_9SAUR